jgi:hypothetical protein
MEPSINLLPSSRDMAILDSGAAVTVVSSNILSSLHNIHHTSTHVATAADGQALQISGEGELGPLSNVLVSDNIRHNCISISQLCDNGYTITFTKYNAQINHPNGSAIGERSGGLYVLPLETLLSFSTPSADDLLNIGSSTPDTDVLDLWHRRLADTSHRIIRESVRTKLIEGITLDRKYFNTKSRKSYRCPCDICARAKAHKTSFPAVRDRMEGLVPGAYMSADVLIMQNIPSREGYKYVLFIIDHASKKSWVFPLKTRESGPILLHLQKFIKEILPSHNIQLRHFHSDGGAELIASDTLAFLHSCGVTTSHSPRDTPQMNSVTERWVRSLKEKVLCMLLRSSLPVAFWWLAVECAVYLLERIPTKTALGYMTPYECLYGRPPDLKWLRIWGCKCYALKPAAERRKDFDDKTYAGHLVGYAQQNTGYMIFVPALDKIIVSVHVIFNEIIPDPTAEYFSELEKLNIKVADDSKDPADYQYLIGQHHLDDEDGLVYETTRVVVRKGFIVAYRRLITSGEFKPREESTPIHIADIVRMTAALQSTPIDDSVSPAAITPRSNTPVVPPQGNISLDPDRRLVVPEEVPLPSSFVPGWNSQGRLATSTPADKRRRLSQGLELRTNLQSEFRTPPRGRRKCKVDHDINFLLCLHLSCPQSYSQALKSPDVEAWTASMASELHTLQHKRKCWEIVPYPKSGHHNYLRCHFVYKIKMKHGKVDRYKSRLVVDGSIQIQGIDYSDSFAPVVKYTTLRIFLSICVVYNMQVHQLDVESAFIYAPLTEEVYMHPHPAMNIPRGHCLRLLKSLYGLRQAPRNWNAHLHDFICSLGFQRNSLDHCLYMGTALGSTVLLAVFVDDILIASENVSAINQIKTAFRNRFQIKDMGLAEEFLNIRITQQPGRISIDQEPYVRTVLEKYQSYIGTRNYADVPSMSEYMPRDESPATPKQRQFVDSFPYSAIVGSLLYLAVVSRPDICFAVGVLTHHLKSPTYASCKAACRVLNYLSHHPRVSIVYAGSTLDLHAYTDSDWGSDRDTRRSTSGGIVIMAGGLVHWLSKLQPIVTVSSMEAEYIACFFIVQEVAWIRQLLKDLRLERTLPTRVYIDNKSARQLAENPVHHQRSKHIDIKFHWIRDMVAAQTIKLIDVPTDDQRADFLTKTLRGEAFWRHVSALLLVSK